MSKSGDSTDDASPRGAVPKLTIGQRVLASLPSLQRPTTNRGGDDIAEPDAVLPPGSDTEAPTSTTTGGSSIKRQPSTVGRRGGPSGMTKEELTTIIKRLDERERVLGLYSAPLGAAVGILLTFGALHYNPAVGVKNHVNPSVIYFEGGARVLLSAVVGLAAWTRRRSFVAFALLFLGTSMGFPFALPFWALGVWLIFRVFKWQKELGAMNGMSGRGRPAPKARAQTPVNAKGKPDVVAQGRATAEARRRARSERLAARRAGVRGGKKQPEPAGPPPSKRYTPPNQTRPRPPAAPR